MSDPVELVPPEGAKDAPPPPPPLILMLTSTPDDDPNKLTQVLSTSDDGVDCADASGMTALMHAAWKGKAKVVKFLIEQGADVNGDGHEHGYTALHFAALAGSEEVCKVLLEHGAKPDKTNTVNRNPAQMAAFVGNSNCVSVINNYVPKDDVFYYTRKQPLETEPKLPLKLAKPLHNLVMNMNTHPVWIAFKLKESPEMLENIGKIAQILEMMSDREFTYRTDVNEVLSLKYHMIHYIVKDIKKQMDKEASSAEKKKLPLIDRWIRSMLLGRESDGYPIFQEDFLRQGVKEFPYKESTLFKMLVNNFSHCKVYGEGLSAAEYINQAFNGQKGFKDDENCSTCGNEKAQKKCASCKYVQYCDQTCQKTHWFDHKKYCPKLKEMWEKQCKQSKTSASEP